MFFFNMKAKSYEKKGMEYTAPFGLYTIISGSMEPNVSVYDVVIAVDTDISKLKVGDIITFISTWDVNYGLTVTHRVVEISKNVNGEYQITTKGDNNQTKDSSTVTQSNLVGKVVGRIPQLGRIQFFLATKTGWFLVVFIPALGVIIFDIIKILKLYFLKNEIDKVQPTRSRKHEMEKINSIDKNNDIIQRPIEQEKPHITTTPPPIPTPVTPKPDENIDTVELPKVGLDGKITENSIELPIIRKKEPAKDEVNTLSDLPLPKNDETIKIPIIKKSTTIDDIGIKLNTQPQKLKRRK